MLFATTVLSHCQTTYVALNGDYREMRDSPNGDHNSFYPLDHVDLVFRDPGNWKYAVCRNTTTKSPNPHTVKPGDSLTLDFRPECNSGTIEGQQVSVMSQGKKIMADTGDWDGGPRHKGGYCQISMTYTQTPEGVNPQWSDFVVIAQYEGRCPDSTSEWEFKLPDQLPSGEAVMMWTWFSAHGRSEMYSTCWDVIVQGNVQDKGIYGFCVLYGNLNETNKFFLPVDQIYKHPTTSGSMEYKGIPGNPSNDSTPVAIKTAPQMGCDDTFDYLSTLSRLPVTGPFGSGYQGTPSLPPVPSSPVETGNASPTPLNNYNSTSNNAAPSTPSTAPQSADTGNGGNVAPSSSPTGLSGGNATIGSNPIPIASGSTSPRRCYKKH
eukprot:NODE_962_length_2875_cov_0.703890.p1 type:complete len:378 gc:universal NODE_962_length_2875_cov_0.703890:2436-1303(-)